ncbi:MAG: TlpA family protein disulfide reductase [Clostridiales bacterium]|nr:TlpA family protein disulfide reductase [Clostridiales bacterium]
MRKIFMVVIWVYLFSSILLTGCVYDKNKDVNEPPESLPDKESSDSSGQSSILPENDEKDDISPQEILKGIAYYEAEAPLLDFEAVDLNGNKVKLSDYEGSIVFLNFWGTWCPPCRREMPHMEQFYKEYKEKGVVLLAVSPTSVELRGGKDAEEAEKRVRDFIESNGYTFPVLLDKDDQAWAIYQQSGVPVNYVIDRDGIIRYLKIGAFLNKEEMERFVKAVEAVQN